MAKKKPDIVTPKLYHGTTETIAKTICAKGLIPYEVSTVDFGVPRRVLASTDSGICLTSFCPGLMAFETADPKERWGIIEIDVSYLSPEHFMPCEGFLVEKTKDRLVDEDDRVKKLSEVRQNLLINKSKWRESLDSYGMCVYNTKIPIEAVSKVTIYDPQSNPTMTRAIILSSGMLGSKLFPSSFSRQKMVTRWLSGGDVTLEEWLGKTSSKLAYTEKTRVEQILRNKNGLDIYYHSLLKGKKISWWHEK